MARHSARRRQSRRSSGSARDRWCRTRVRDQVPDVRVLDRDEAVVGEQVGDAGDEVVEVGHVSHHVAGDDDVGRAVLVADGERLLEAEKATDGRDADRTRRLHGPGDGSMPRVRTPAATKLRSR